MYYVLFTHLYEIKDIYVFVWLELLHLLFYFYKNFDEEVEFHL